MKANTTNSEKAEWLLLIRSNNDLYQEYNLKPGINYIGRDGENDIILGDSTSSSFHAEIHYNQEKSSVAIRDCDSTNGTFVNSRQIRELHALYHEDQIRVGLCLITLIQSKENLLKKNNRSKLKTKVTTDLILESIDQYGVLLHTIGQQLVNVPDIDLALSKISKLIKSMLGAEEVQVILGNKFNQLEETGIPVAIAKKTIENKTANIFLYNEIDPQDNKKEATIPVQSLHPMMLVPVMIDDDVVALIFARKPLKSSTHFYNSDLQVVLAISNQVAMSLQRNRVEGELLYKSNHDSLTDLPNRAFFLNHLQQSLIRSKQEKGVEFAVLFFDIDDFKIVNDSLGHVVGDKLLLAMAERLKHNIRSGDLKTGETVIARFGGDEFAVLLNDVNENLFAIATANRLKEALSKPYNISGKKIFSSVSIGVAVSTTGYDSPEDILQDADMAMYQAKELGKEQVAIFDHSMRDRALERMRIGTALKQSLQKEFQLHYQPIISLESGRIAGFEALLRWYTTDRGILRPNDFLDLLDTAGLNYLTDYWVLQNACSQAVEWQNSFPKNPPLYITVNLSAKNINHPNLVDNINQVLQDTKLDPKNLCLEITERATTSDNESTIEVLRKIRSMGVRITIDDFGTGYSALNYLAQFPVDVLKIDQSFIQMVGVKEASKKIIEMVKALANHLGITVVAEGVEKAEQLEFVKSINCEYAQGYYYSKPLDAKSATELLTEGPQF